MLVGDLLAFNQDEVLDGAADIDVEEEGRIVDRVRALSVGSATWGHGRLGPGWYVRR